MGCSVTKNDIVIYNVPCKEHWGEKTFSGLTLINIGLCLKKAKKEGLKEMEYQVLEERLRDGI